MYTILINYTGRTGAGISYAYEMCKAFLNNGVNVYAIISKQANNYCDWCKLPGLNLIGIDTYENKFEFIMATLKFCKKRNEIKKKLQNIKIDAEYVPMPTYWSGLISELFKDVPKYYTVHDVKLHSGEKFFNKIWWFFLERELKKCRKIIVLSSIFVEEAKTKYGKNNKDIVVLPHPAFWEYKSKYIPSDYKSYPFDKVNFLFFGRIERYKGIDILLKAYHKVFKNVGDRITLTIAGKGSLLEYSENINAGKNISVINEMIPDERIGALFNGNRVVTVLPYRDATQSGVIPTAAMFNSLTIVTDVGALSEQVGYGKYGIVVDANDPNSLADAMLDVVNYFDKYKKIIVQANENIKPLTWDNIARRLISEMKKI